MGDQIISAGSWPRPLPGWRVLYHTTHQQVDVSNIALLSIWSQPATYKDVAAAEEAEATTFVNARVAEQLVQHQSVPAEWDELEIVFAGTTFWSHKPDYHGRRVVHYIRQDRNGVWKLEQVDLESALTAVVRGERQVRFAALPPTVATVH